MTTQGIKKRAALNAAKLSLIVLVIVAALKTMQYIGAGLNGGEQAQLRHTIEKNNELRVQIDEAQAVVAQSRHAFEDWNKNKEGLLIDNTLLEKNLNDFFEKLKEKYVFLKGATVLIAPDNTYVNVSQVFVEITGMHTAPEMQDAVNEAAAELIAALMDSFSKELGILQGSLSRTGNAITYAYKKDK